MTENSPTIDKEVVTLCAGGSCMTRMERFTGKTPQALAQALEAEGHSVKLAACESKCGVGPRVEIDEVQKLGRSAAGEILRLLED